MNPEDAVDLGREALRTCLMVGGPILAVGLLIGLLVGVLQAMTQVQDQTVSFVPKIILMILAIALALPWLSEQMVDFAKQSFESPMISLSAQEPSFVPAANRPFNSIQPHREPGQPEDEVAIEFPASSMPTLGKNLTMPNMTNRSHSSMPMMSSAGPDELAEPRVAESSGANRNK